MELPVVVDFPINLVYTMFSMAIITSFVAVHVPVSAVNNQMVAMTLKGLANN